MLDYYASHGPITDPGAEAKMLDRLPADARPLPARHHGIPVRARVGFAMPRRGAGSCSPPS